MFAVLCLTTSMRRGKPHGPAAANVCSLDPSSPRERPSHLAEHGTNVDFFPHDRVPGSGVSSAPWLPSLLHQTSCWFGRLSPSQAAWLVQLLRDSFQAALVARNVAMFDWWPALVAMSRGLILPCAEPSHGPVFQHMKCRDSARWLSCNLQQISPNIWTDELHAKPVSRKDASSDQCPIWPRSPGSPVTSGSLGDLVWESE